MKTNIEWDNENGRYKKKESTLFAVLRDQSDAQNIGQATIDLADFVKVDKHQRQLVLGNLM